MATLYITEYKQLLAYYTGVTGQIVQTPPVAEQTVAIGGTSAQSSAFNANTGVIRVTTDAICSVYVGGTNPTATTGSSRMAVSTYEYYAVTPGDKLAVIANT